MLPLDEEIHTPTGFKAVRDLRVGDSVTTSNGEATTITEMNDPVEAALFRLTTDTGSSIRCSEMQQVRAGKAYYASAFSKRPIGDLRGSYDREELYLAKFGGMRPVKVRMIEAIAGTFKCVGIKVGSTDGLFCGRGMLLLVGGT